uniref:Late embryogenesis abundant protein LEA-2 subgroup domain-containing protein n=1 Tax=Psilocybe cubensis TaxID=181762 RepID=A0A8H7Y907_PSICU
MFGLRVLLAALVAGAASASPAAPATDLGIADIINLLNIGLVKDINAFVTLESLTTNVISVNFDVKNPLPIELTLDSVSAVAGLNGTIFATFTHTFPKPGLVVPPLATKNSGLINNVQLPQGGEASLSIIPFGILDLPDTNANVRAATIGGALGIPIALTGLKQTAVPTNYTLELD